jgi:hypothetical protein
MGYSADSIPDHLLHPDAKTQFVLWLNSIPLDQSAKRSLIAAWTRATNSTFSLLDYAAANLPSGKG